MSLSKSENRNPRTEPAQGVSQVERVHVQMDSGQLKIRSEHFDEKLGWYISGSLQLPDHLLPLLEQALERAKTERATREKYSNKVLPFPNSGL